METRSNTKAANNEDENRVLSLLRSVHYPGFQRDIVAFGFVKDIEVEGARVTVHFAPNTRNQEKIEQMEEDIRKTLGDAGSFKKVEIHRHQPFETAGVRPNGGEIPLGQQNSIAPDGDISQSDLRRPDMAPEAGYNEDGPEPLGGPLSDDYEGELPVFQWEIDPQDPAAKSGEANLSAGEWEFRLWWQVHPERLVYASIQAMREDWVAHGGAARSHPVGRSEVVNLVYDVDRKAVVAIYGTVKDFRPFVDAFYRGYVLQN